MSRLKKPRNVGGLTLFATPEASNAIIADEKARGVAANCSLKINSKRSKTQPLPSPMPSPSSPTEATASPPPMATTVEEEDDKEPRPHLSQILRWTHVLYVEPTLRNFVTPAVIRAADATKPDAAPTLVVRFVEDDPAGGERYAEPKKCTLMTRAVYGDIMKQCERAHEDWRHRRPNAMNDAEHERMLDRASCLTQWVKSGKIWLE